MNAVDAALTALDGARADRILDDMVYELRCMRDIVQPADLGRMARQVSLVAFYAQDNDEMRYWGLLARETAGDAPWPDGLTIPGRYFELIDALPTPEVGHGEGGLDVPKGGGALLDGVLVTEPVATVGVQHLLQVADKRGAILVTTWQTGPAFPEEWRTDDARALPVPKWYVAPATAVEPVPEPAPVEPEPQPEPEPQVVAAVPEPEPVVPEPLAKPVSFEGDGKTAECPWRIDPRVVEASGREIRINRHIYPVRTVEDQAAFKTLLKSCGEFRAVRRFTRWQDARGGWFTGAKAYKAEMIDALLTEEPKRRPKAQ